MFQEIISEIISNLEYGNIPYEVIMENEKTVICVTDKNGKVGKITFEM